MKPEFVLDEDAISQRFKYSRSKNAAEEEDDEGDMVIASDAPAEPSSSNSQPSPASAVSQSLEASSQSSPVAYLHPSPSSSVIVNSSPSYPCPPLLQLSPQYTPPHLTPFPQYNPPTAHHQPPSTHLHQLEPPSVPQDLSSFVRVSVIRSNPTKPLPSTSEPELDIVYPEEVVDVKLEDELRDVKDEPMEDSVLKLEQDKTQARDADVEEIQRHDSSSSDDILLKTYVHKKFRKQFPQIEILFELDKFDELVLSEDSTESEEEQSKVSLYNSLMVSNSDPNMDIKFEEEMEKTFMSSFREINLGEDVMSAYIDFCVKRHDLDPRFYSSANLQFK